MSDRARDEISPPSRSLPLLFNYQVRSCLTALPLKPLVKLTRNRYSAFPHAYLIQYPDARHGASP